MNVPIRFITPPIAFGRPVGHRIPAKTKNTINVFNNQTIPPNQPFTFDKADFIVILLNLFLLIQELI